MSERAERRSRIKTQPDEVYADGGVIREHIYGQAPEVLVTYDLHSHLTITNYSPMEWQVGGTINRITSTKSGHSPRTICEFKLVTPDPDEDMYKFEVHSGSIHAGVNADRVRDEDKKTATEKREYPIIKAHNLTDLDLAVGLLLSNGDPKLAKKTRHTGIKIDKEARTFFAKARTEARAHRHPHNC